MNLDHLIPWDKIPKHIVAVARQRNGTGEFLALNGYYVSEGLTYDKSLGTWRSDLLEGLFGSDTYGERVDQYFDRPSLFPIMLPIEQCLFIRPSVTKDMKMLDLEGRIAILERQVKALTNAAKETP